MYCNFNNVLTSSQDGRIGKHSSPPCTTTAKLQLNYKTAIIQNHQKIKLYGSLTTKELKKLYSFRWVGGYEMWRCLEMQRNRPSHTHMWWVKIGRDFSGASYASPTP